MSGYVRRSSRLQDKRAKLVSKIRKKTEKKTRKRSCRILDDDSSSSNAVDDSASDDMNDSVRSNNTSFTGNKNRIGSIGGNFTRM